MKRLLVAALALASVPGAAAACTVEPGYRVPSNLELVEQAETIVLAKVVGATASAEEGGADGDTVIIRPIAALKGELPAGDIGLRGMGLAQGNAARLDMLSNPFEFRQAHPIAYMGACIRTYFPLGTTAVFFLRTDHEGMWAPAAQPFSRWAEDVPEGNAPWVQLVKLYAVAAGLPQADRAPFLADEREALLARTGEPLAQLMAEDIARQVAGPAAAADEPLAEDAFRPPSQESAVEAALRAMRQSGEEAGN